MKRLFLLQSACVALLALGLIVVLGRMVDRAGLSWDLGGRNPSSVSGPLRSALRQLPSRLEATLFVSPAHRMPSHLRQVEETTRRLLASIQDVAGDRFSYRVLDPDVSGEAGARYAASRRVSPIRVRSVIDDRESQTEIWSSLVLAREGQRRRDDILIQGIENAHLPHLGSLLAAHLQPQAPQPAFALSAPDGFEHLPRTLSQHGPVVEVDVDATAFIPDNVDILFWLDPQQVTPRHVVTLRRFLQRGGTAVVAGSPFRMHYTGQGDDVQFQAIPTGTAWSGLLEPFGLRPLPDLVMDTNASSAPVLVDGVLREIEAPFHLRNLPAFRDFRPFRTPARGGLSFIAPGPLAIDPQRVAAAGYDAHVAATTTERAWVRHMPDGPFDLQDTAADLSAPKQNLMVLLTPQDPWAGELLVLASSSPFRDHSLTQPGFGHTVFVRDLARSFADPERVVRRRVDRDLPAPIPALSDGERIIWRGIVVGLVPAGWLAVAFVLLSTSGRRRSVAQSLAARGRLVAVPAAGLVVWLILHPALGGWQVDGSQDRRHTAAANVLAALRGHSGLRAELLQSPTSSLPAAVQQATARLQRVLAQADVPSRVILTDETDAPSFDVERVQRDTAVTTSVVSALRLWSGARSVLVPRIDAGTAPHLDFLLAAALRQLETGRAPVIAVISDLPRLSPAEALEDFQKKGLSAPQGVDVYSRAKNLLHDYGYDVRHVSMRSPTFPDAPDAVLWFQPRRDSTPILTQLSQHLANGGRGIVALQHFNIQQRQYRGTGFETVHWPQPQFQDFDRYLQPLGIQQAREVLFDRSRHHLELDTQVNRTAVREYDAQRVALPFLIRAVGAHFDRQSPLTERLGDLLFIWGNRFAVDAERLRDAGLSAQTLISTSPGAWSFDWSGGWLPGEVLAGPGGGGIGAQPLAVEVRGRFPAVEAVRIDGGGTQLQPVANDTPASDGALWLIGSSEMFKDRHLLRPEFAHDQLLLNVTAAAAYGPQMAVLQARHGGGSQGFPDASSAARWTWRLAVIGGGPILLGLLAAWRWRRGVRS